MSYLEKLIHFQNKVHIEAELLSHRTDLASLKLPETEERENSELDEFQVRIGVCIKDIFECFVREFKPDVSSYLDIIGIYPYLLETWVERSIGEYNLPNHKQIDMAVFRYAWKWLSTTELSMKICDQLHPCYGYDIQMYAGVRSHSTDISSNNPHRHVIKIIMVAPLGTGCCIIL